MGLDFGRRDEAPSQPSSLPGLHCPSQPRPSEMVPLGCWAPSHGFCQGPKQPAPAGAETRGSSLQGAKGAEDSPEPVAHLLENLRLAAPPLTPPLPSPPRALRTPPQRVGLDRSHLRPGHRRGRGRGPAGDPLPPQPRRRRGLRGLHHQQRHPPLLQDRGTRSPGVSGKGVLPLGRASRTTLRSIPLPASPTRLPAQLRSPPTHTPPPRAVQPPLCTQNMSWLGVVSPEDLS